MASSPYAPHHSLRTTSAALCLALLTACTPKDDGEPTGAPGTSSSSGAAEDSDPSGATGTATSTMGDTGTDATDATDATAGPDDTGDATDGPDVTSDATDPTGDTDDTGNDTGDTGSVEPLPPECTAQDPSVSAAFEFRDGWHDWSGKIITDCDVDAVTLEADDVITTLTCGVETSLLRTAAAVEGPPAWQAGDAVRLRTFAGVYEDISPGEESWLELRLAADDSLLILGVNSQSIPTWGAPFTIEASHPCGPEVGVNESLSSVPLQLDFQHPDGSLGLVHGHRGVVPIDGTPVYAIDVQYAQGDYSAHAERWHHYLIRRVASE